MIVKRQPKDRPTSIMHAFFARRLFVKPTLFLCSLQSGCQCCHGYIYGCDEQVCYELGKCICSLEEGEGTGDVKKKKGKYEFIEIKSHKRERR